MSKRDQQRILKQLLQNFQSASAKVREEAVERLGLLDSAEAYAHLLKAVDDPDPDVCSSQTGPFLSRI